MKNSNKNSSTYFKRGTEKSQINNVFKSGLQRQVLTALWFSVIEFTGEGNTIESPIRQRFHK